MPLRPASATCLGICQPPSLGKGEHRGAEIIMPDNGRMEGQRMAAYSPDALDPRRCAGWLLWGDCVEKGGIGRGIISHHDSWGAVDDGGEASPSGRVVLRVLTRTTCAGEAPAAVDRSVRRTRRTAAGIGAVLQ